MQSGEMRTVWMDGELMPWEKANVHVSPGALHHRSGVSEGLRCYATERGPAVFRLEEHIDRLFAAAFAHGIEIPYTPGELGAAVCQTIAANDFESCYVRTIVSFGSATLSLKPRRPVGVAVLAWPRPRGEREQAGSRGVRADRYRHWLHFVDDCTFAGAYSALPCI